jgi:hypothetical protein
MKPRIDGGILFLASWDFAQGFQNGLTAGRVEGQVYHGFELRLSAEQISPNILTSCLLLSFTWSSEMMIGEHIRSFPCPPFRRVH